MLKHLVLAFVMGASLVVPGGPLRAQTPDAAKTSEVLSDVRKALGGDKAAKIAALSVEGTYRRTFGEREMSGDIELAMELPDKFLRTETFGFDPTAPMRRFSGFNGQAPIESTSGGGGRMMIRMGPGAGSEGRELSEDEVKARRLRAAHRDFARLLVALVAGSSSSFPLDYHYAGEAESEDGKADVLDVRGPEDFTARLFVDKTSRLPLMLVYRDAMPRMQMFRGAPGSTPPSREEIERRMKEMREAGPPPQVDVQLFLSDHKRVDGVLLPHTIRRAVDGTTVEEWTIETFKVNPSFKADKFEKK